jgi:hypothetical protein
VQQWNQIYTNTNTDYCLSLSALIHLTIMVICPWDPLNTSAVAMQHNKLLGAVMCVAGPVSKSAAVGLGKGTSGVSLDGKELPPT